ncbi:MAG: hypothetical protein Q9220_002441 [cf. Caloplaca sp. 1 TL-2023]
MSKENSRSDYILAREKGLEIEQLQSILADLETNSPVDQYSQRILKAVEGNVPDYLQDLNNPSKLFRLPLPRQVLYKHFEERWNSTHRIPSVRECESDIASPARSLCDDCQPLDLQISDFTRESRKKSEVHYIGAYEEVRKRNCSLCRLVARVIELQDNARVKVQKDPTLICGLVFSWSDHFEYHSLLRTIDFYQGHQPRALAVFIANGTLGSHSEEATDALLIKDPVIEHFDDFTAFVPFKARLYESPHIDVSLVKIWLGACSEWHGDTCEFASIVPGNSPSGLPFFRLIDVESLYLAHFGGLPESSYIALSYVWGSAKQVLTKYADLAALSEPGGLQNIMDSVPLTIRDAMALTKELGLKYLWVDSLCIVQDDPYDKAIFIPEMHQIYMRSFLTIIAAAGNSADNGLPGIGPSPRDSQEIEEISPGFHLGILPSYGRMLKESVHTTRPWT